MMRQSSSRNQRSKKLKMKQALQLFLLLAISIWLLYQLKHTFDKKQAVNATANDSDENPITKNNERVPDKTSKLGRKYLPQITEDSNTISGESENEVDEEDEEKDTELEQLLDDGEVRENGQEEEERSAEENGEDRDEESADSEYGVNGEEEEEVRMDGDTNGDVNEIGENGTMLSANSSISVGSGSASNQSVSVDLSINKENITRADAEVKEGIEKLGVQDELHAIQNTFQSANETTAEVLPYLSTKVVGTRGEIKEG